MSRIISRAVALAFITALWGCVAPADDHQANTPPATLVTTGTLAWTGGPERPGAEAMAVRGDEIVAGVPAGERILNGAWDPTGNPADFVLLDTDITAATPERIREARVLHAVVDGRIIYSASAP